MHKNKNAFWNRTEPRTIGDLVGRPRTLELLGDVQGLDVMDFGCGTGYMTRQIARKGAKAYGIDFDPESIAIAKRLHKQEFGEDGNYDVADVRGAPGQELPVVDKIMCHSVLTYMSEEDMAKAYHALAASMHEDSTAIVTIAHPTMADKASPAYENPNNWVSITPIGDGKVRQDYRDIDGNMWSTSAWYHSESTHKQHATEAGLEARARHTLIEKHHLLREDWGSQYGYPIFLHLELSKA